jgi:divalent metal cation (Fe/Co/Zn/Cd) transporter
MAVEKLAVRKSGLNLHATIHVQADSQMSLDAAHQLGGRVKAAMRQQMPRLTEVLVHMEPYPADSSSELPTASARITSS